MNVSCITPTGARPEALALAQKYMRRQSFTDFGWIVLDDCDPASAMADDPRITTIRPGWRWSKGLNTQAPNMIALIDHALSSDCELLLVIEDDEWYVREYVETMLETIRRHPERIIVGESNARFYNVRLRHGRCLQNKTHTALCRTGVTRAGMLLMREVFEKPIPRGLAHDRVLWDSIPPAQKLIFDSERPLNVGIKGMPGRLGIGTGHDRIKHDVIRDYDMSLLKAWIGDDADHYAKYFQATGEHE